jgi:amino acid permease
MNEKNDLEEPLISNNENLEKLNENMEYLPSEEIIENGNIKYRKNLNKTENMKDSNKKIERKPTMGDISLSSLLFRPIESGSLRSSVYGLICVTLGTGMLPLPYFFRTNGILLTLIIFFFCAFPTYITLKLLTTMSYEFKIYAFDKLIAHLFGRNSLMEIYTIIVLLINSFGSIIMWNVFISEFAKDILGYFNSELGSETNLILILFFILIFIQIPLAVFSSGKEFDIMSTIGMFQIVYVLFVVIFEFPNYLMENFDKELFGEMETYFNFNIKIVEMPFIFFIAFGNHSTILTVIQQIKDKTHERVSNVGKKTFYAEFGIYLLVFFICYFSTFQQTEQIFLTRPNTSFLMLIGEFFMMILMICNIALYFFTSTPTFEFILNDGKELSQKQKYFSSFIVLTTLMIISFYINEVDTILAFLGVTAQVSLIFIIPISMYIKWKENTISYSRKIMFICLILFFTLLGVGGFILMIYNQFRTI